MSAKTARRGQRMDSNCSVGLRRQPTIFSVSAEPASSPLLFPTANNSKRQPSAHLAQKFGQKIFLWRIGRHHRPITALFNQNGRSKHRTKKEETSWKAVETRRWSVPIVCDLLISYVYQYFTMMNRPLARRLAHTLTMGMKFGVDTPPSRAAANRLVLSMAPLSRS